MGTQRMGSGREDWVESMTQVAQMGVTWEPRDLRAWETGGAGFAIGEVIPALPDGTRLPMRFTSLLVREDGDFRIFNIHFSWAVPDEIAWPQVSSWREQLGLVAA